ncbi:DUF262 domain-containing protein [Xanthobacter autotrophicus]|uniref:DUF262 domain-containing protein n=1 Tax=Xanthobacter autotrophicus TaxID=280 RepID=UPI00372CDC26
MSSSVPTLNDVSAAAEAEAQPEMSAFAAGEETKSSSWFESDDADEASASFKDYEVIASPNDFNVQTIVNFVSSGAVKIPGFQRNFVWDIKRASRLIESILIGLPIPQIFLYQETKNSFLVVDGQQRLMSIFYFVTGRFPKAAKRPVLRRIMDEKGALPSGIIGDDTYFAKFNLQLATKGPGIASRYHGQNYDTLADRMSFDLRTIRNVVIKQAAPLEEPDTSVFEIFNRLNTGGVNLRPQEIRSSLYHSDFLAALHRVNLNPVWRAITGLPDPDLHDKDVEVLLRVIALVSDGESYSEPMSGFLNQFAKKARKLPADKIAYIENLFAAFFEMIKGIPPEDFAVAKSNRFNIAAFEGIFRAACTLAFDAGNLTIPGLNAAQIHAVRSDPDFLKATQESVGRSVYVRQRFDRAKAVLGI